MVSFTENKNYSFTEKKVEKILDLNERNEI